MCATCSCPRDEKCRGNLLGPVHLLHGRICSLSFQNGSIEDDRRFRSFAATWSVSPERGTSAVSGRPWGTDTSCAAGVPLICRRPFVLVADVPDSDSSKCAPETFRYCQCAESKNSSHKWVINIHCLSD